MKRSLGKVSAMIEALVASVIGSTLKDSLGKVSAMIEALVASVIGSTLKDYEVFGNKLSRCFDSA